MSKPSRDHTTRPARSQLGTSTTGRVGTLVARLCAQPTVMRNKYPLTQTAAWSPSEADRKLGIVGLSIYVPQSPTSRRGSSKLAHNRLFSSGACVLGVRLRHPSLGSEALSSLVSRLVSVYDRFPIRNAPAHRGRETRRRPPASNGLCYFPAGR